MRTSMMASATPPMLSARRVFSRVRLRWAISIVGSGAPRRGADARSAVPAGRPLGAGGDDGHRDDQRQQPNPEGPTHPRDKAGIAGPTGRDEEQSRRAERKWEGDPRPSVPPRLPPPPGPAAAGPASRSSGGAYGRAAGVLRGRLALKRRRSSVLSVTDTELSAIIAAASSGLTMTRNAG